MQAPLRAPEMRQGRRRRAPSAPALGGLVVGLVLTAGACSSGGTKHALPTSPTPTSTATTAVVSTTSSTSTTTTTPVVTTTSTPLRVVDLAGCPPDSPDADLTRLNGQPAGATDLVAIDALNVRICKYGPAKSRPRLLGISWLALSEAAAFVTETNKLASGAVTSTTQAGTTCTTPAQESTSFLLTFAVDTQTVNLYAGGCPPIVSNGTLTAPATAQWYSELARYASHAGAAAKAP